MGESGTKRLWFRDRHRLTKAREFQAAFGERMSSRQGPLTIFAHENGLGHARLGLSVGRRVGGAVRRNAVKRRIREAFRLSQHDLPDGYDLVVAVREHPDTGLESYRRWLVDGARQAVRRWEKRRLAGDGEGEGV